VRAWVPSAGYREHANQKSDDLHPGDHRKPHRAFRFSAGIMVAQAISLGP
jgi:hypothetical protein